LIFIKTNRHITKLNAEKEQLELLIFLSDTSNIDKEDFDMEKSKPIMTDNDANYIRAIYVAVDMLKLELVDLNDFWAYEKIIAAKYHIEDSSIYKMTESTLNLSSTK